MTNADDDKDKNEALQVVVRDPRELAEVSGYFVQRADRAQLRVKLLDWADNPLPIGQLAALELRHKGSRPAVNRWAFRKDDVDALTKKIAEDLENDAMRLPNAWQEYVLEAFFGNASFPQSSWKERVRWNEGRDEFENDNAALSLRPDGVGAMQLLQKAFRDAVLATSEDRKGERSLIRGLLKDAIEREAELWQRIRYLEAENARMFGVYQEALDRKQEREIKAERAREFLRGMRDLADSAKLYIPVLANHFLGDKVFPVPDFAHPMLELLKQLYESVTRDSETLGTILEALSKNKPAYEAFGRLMSKVEDWRDLAKERAKVAVEAEQAAAKKDEPTTDAKSGERPRAASGMRANGFY